MLEKIEINGVTYTPLKWLDIFINSRSSASFTDTASELMEVFGASSEEAGKFVHEYITLRDKL